MNRCFLLPCFLLLVFARAFTQSLPANSSVSSVANSAVISELEFKMMKAGLVNIKKYIPDAVLDIRYATDNNFLKVNVYGNYNQCYLQPDVALKLQKADSLLKAAHPAWKFVLYDCARPVSVQVKMWNALKMPVAEKGKYVSNPQNLSVHNLGAAIDLGLADDKNIYLDMGTDFDYFGELAYPFMEAQLVKAGKLAQKQVDNRKALRDAMKNAGFTNVPHEWWHFNAYSRNIARTKYKAVP